MMMTAVNEQMSEMPQRVLGKTESFEGNERFGLRFGARVMLLNRCKRE